MNTCKICKSHSEPLFKEKTSILQKYPIDYFKCTSCGFIQTENPYWLEEAYNSAITSLDIGLVHRNIRVSKYLYAVITLLFDRKASYLDYGGGYGMLVRMMRDLGYDFFRFDTHCENVFSVHFDLSDTNKRKFELLTAFEVFEHLVDPIEEAAKMLELSDSIFFSTELIPDKQILHPNDWWYFTPETGQHVSIYSLESLKRLAKHFGCNFYSDGYNLHLITKRNISQSKFWLATKGKVSTAIPKIYKQESLLLKDLNLIRTMLNEEK